MAKPKQQEMALKDFDAPIDTTPADLVVVGWYQPHGVGSKMTEWDGLVADPKTGELVKEESMTKQSFKAECDINNIIKQFQNTGIVSHINEQAKQGMYADLPPPLDYQESLELVRQAQTSFDSLPSKVRNRFDNDPEKFLAFVADPANQQEMVDLGLATGTPPQAPERPAPPAAPADKPKE